MPYNVVRLEAHFLVNWGWAPSAATNKSAGVSLMFNNKLFTTQHIVAIRSPSDFPGRPRRYGARRALWR